MILCLDIGNSQIFGGVFDHDKIALRFRHEAKLSGASDQLGVFLKSVLRENDLDPCAVKQIAICSVVPAMDYSIRAACRKYFDIDPFFLQAGVKTGIQIKTKNPSDTGSDLIAGVVGAIDSFPDKTLIVADFGTVTTYAFVSKNKEFLGATFLPGFRLAMSALGSTAKLFPVDIKKPKSIMGRSTAGSMRSGLYYHQVGMLKEVISQSINTIFDGEKPLVISTGGFAYLLKEENLFHSILPNMVLEGLKITLQKNV